MSQLGSSLLRTSTRKQFKSMNVMQEPMTGPGDTTARFVIYHVPRRGVNIHMTHTHKTKNTKTSMTVSCLVDFCSQSEKLVEQQKLRSVVHCGDHPLENVFKFKYLVSIQEDDSLQKYDDYYGLLQVW